jgi:uncharacterized protein YacL
MNVDLVFRLGGAALFAVGGWYLGSIVEFPFSPLTWLPLNLLGAGLGSIAGFVSAPYLTTRPASFLIDQARRLHVKDLVAAVLGLLVALVLSALLAIPLSLLPGEEMSIRVIREGKEPGQGVDYLSDGTMIVVDGGRRFIDSDIGVVVTRVFQTAAGRMIFAHVRENHREGQLA